MNPTISINRLHAKGWQPQSIASTLGVSRSVVYETLGMEHPQRGTTESPDVRWQLRDLYNRLVNEGPPQTWYTDPHSPWKVPLDRRKWMACLNANFGDVL